MAAGVKSVGATLDVIDCVANAPEGASLAEISAALELSKPSILRHLSTLVDRGYLIRNALTLRYSLGPRLYVLGELAASSIDLLSLADPVMRKLRDEVGLTVNLATFGKTGVVIVKSILGINATEVRVRIGAEFPFHATSQGRVALAFSRQDLMPAVREVGLVRFTEHTITDFDELAADVARVRDQGWCMASEETRIGINALSAPVFDRTGECIAAITLVGLTHNLKGEPDPTHISALTAFAAQLTKQLGGTAQR
ncbi:MAG: IclR family transcriptional regulator [Rhizobiaceae bacterium]|nr:IclR family transcriptional regulator [Rhizobiaceae bacterium]